MKTFKAKGILEKHLETHSDNTYHCVQCDKTFKTERSLKKHLQGFHTEGKPYECQVCINTFKCEESLKIHMEIHSYETYKCEQCGKAFKMKRYLREHVKSHSLSNEKTDENDTDNVHNNKMYKCAKCEKTFKKKFNLKRHIQTKHSSPTDRVILNKQTNSEQNPDECDHANLDKNKSEFQCENCLKCYTLRGTLATHIKVCTGKCMLKCDYCDKTFSHKS